MTEHMGVEPIALIGLACRVPGARDAQRFWANLTAGVESIRWFSREEQLKLGTPPELVDHPDFVPASPVLDDIEYFDAGFFGMTDREADVADPQHRLFLELAQTALDDGGYDTSRYKGSIGVYAGTGADDYVWLNLKSHTRLLGQVGRTYVNNVNSPDYVATLASYKLDLRGPSLTLHTACSTSLVAVHLACEALRGGECDMALAGGVNVELPHGRGYVSVEGGIESQDGHCRPFDSRASGTVWASGGGVVLLKRLADAEADGDHIHAVILGNAINNDGSGKVGFTAPSVEGQIDVVANALGLAGIDPRSVSYVEAHGTGTHMGDPIEIAALTQSYGHGAQERAWCRIGSVKSNFGHMSQAAGVIGLIKTVLSLENELIPPSLNYESPNPALNLASSPFTVNAVLSGWKREPGRPRRAGVSSFGIGGTNAHMILEEAPATPATPAPPATGADGPQLLQISARSDAAVATGIQQLAAHLEAHPELSLADVAHTLHIGRRPYAHRATVVATTPAEAAQALLDRKRVQRGAVAEPLPRIAFLFSGQGAQHAGMAAALYAHEPVFREAIEACAAILGHDPLAGDDERLNQTEHTQPALFAVEYGLARLWESWGVRPAAMLGHSIGEYVAATLAGVFTLPDAVRLVATRGRLMQSLPPGSMLALQAAEDQVRADLPAELSIAVVNGPGTCVVAGPSDAIDAYAEVLRDKRISGRMLRTSHAFHSPMMEPILTEFTQAVAAARPQAPDAAFLSNRTGDWITAEQATDPAYWAGHLRQTVRFGECVARLLDYQLVECGPGKQLVGLARMQSPAHVPLPSLPGPGERVGDLETIYATAGRLWATGIPVSVRREGRRVPLPPYPFERAYHWIDPAPESAAPAKAQPSGPLDMSRWCHVPVWRQLPPAIPSEVDGPVLVIGGADLPVATEAIRVEPGANYAVALQGFSGGRVIYAAPDPFYGLLALAQALIGADRPIHLDVVTKGAFAVVGGDLTDPEQAMVAGIAKVLPLEAPQISVRHIDTDSWAAAATEMAVAPSGEHAEVVALRAGRRWAPDSAEVPLPPAVPLREGGVYLITGGVGGIGITLAEDLGVRHRARLVLVSRGGLVGERGARAAAAIARIEAAGGEVLALAADVTDAGALREVRARILDRFGRLDGIVHAAGIAGGGLIEVKTREAASAVIGPKVLGTQALAEAFGDLELDFVALCGSVTGVVGGLGQADYAAANAFLDAYAQGGSGFRGRVLSIDWGGWLELGMAAETARPEILRAGAGSPFDHPILTKRLGDNGFAGTVSPATHWVLGEHHVGGVPVMPGTGHLEIARAAIAAAAPQPGPDFAVELRDVAFLAALAVPSSSELRVDLEPADDGFDFAITAGGMTHVRGNGGWVRSVASTVDIAALREGFAPLTDVSGQDPNEPGRLVFVGPRWRSLKAFHQLGTQALALLEATDEVAAELDRWVLHPALLDEATSFTTPQGEGSHLPLGYGRITVHAPLTARFWAHAHRRTTGAGETLDLQLIDDDGRVLADIADFVLRPVDASAMRQNVRQPGPRPAAANAGIEEAGIRPEEGAEVFRRLIATDLGPQVVVNVRGMADAFARVRAVTTSAVADGTGADVLSERATAIERDRDFEAPRTELEAQLAEIWGTVLGVSGVARDDDFFDLGGNSLVAVQLVAQVRKATQVKLPMRSLFEASSVAAMAELVESLRTESDPEPEADVTIPRLARPA
jgi:acyl transferase domain-containing protein